MKKLHLVETLCANCGHPRSEHEGQRCQGGGGCGQQCPCRKFVPVK